jgi:hypothetical protein
MKILEDPDVSLFGLVGSGLQVVNEELDVLSIESTFREKC